jgi:hypothetical protein
MSLDAFRQALYHLDDPVACEGKHELPATERFAVALPDGDVGALDDKSFVKWLVAQSEPAPFGQGGETKHDNSVRDGLRLRARGKASIAGFDPAAILDEIEAALSPHEHLEARLLDVLTYRKGGHFRRHQDTPHDPDLVGTLVVGLPIPYEGGQLAAGEDVYTEWGTPEPGVLPWVAMHCDLEHQIFTVKSGTRVTLVYELLQSGRARHDAARAEHVAKLAAAARGMTLAEGPLLIGCTHHVITGDAIQVHGLDQLRGADRTIADALVAQGFDVTVRVCVTAVDASEIRRDDADPLRNDDNVIAVKRLKAPLTRKVIGQLDSIVTFAESADYDGEDYPASSLAPYILDDVPRDRWIFRERAKALFIHHSVPFSPDGYFGNSGFDANIYTLAALEVTPGKQAKPRAKRKLATKKKPRARR